MISRVSAELIDFCDDEGIKYHSELTTNGYYLDEIIPFIKQLRIMDTQITIDGEEHEYLKRKNYIQNDNAYQRVIDNAFKASANGNQVTLRLNFDRNNVESIKLLTKVLLNDKRWNDKISLYYYPLQPNDETIGNCFLEEQYESIISELYQYLYECGYYKNRSYALSFHKLILPCYGATLRILAIDYQGYLYQCQHLLCRKEYAIGNVYDGVEITQNVMNWFDGSIRKECMDCEALPLCQGGCVTKSKLGQKEYICHIIRYRLHIQEKLRALQYEQ